MSPFVLAAALLSGLGIASPFRIVVIDASVQWSDVLSYPNDPFIV